MRKSITLLLAFFLCWSLSTPQAALGQEESDALGEATQADFPHSHDHVLVKLRRGASAEKAVGSGAEQVFDRWQRVPVPPGRSPIEIVHELANRPGVEIAELDYRIQVEPSPTPVALAEAQAAATDPYASYQWHFPPVQVPEAWEEATGTGVVVAVVDSGISQGGDDLDCHSFVHPYNAITNTASLAAAVDDNGHGTHVAGTVAQCTNNGVGVAGIAFKAKLMPVKVLDADGVGDTSSIAEGIQWAADHGADVINLSLGCELAGCSSSIIDDAITAAVDADAVLVAAAGNSSLNHVAYPANRPDVIGVGAVDLNLIRAHYSNRGTALDLVAPGGDVNQDANSDGYVDGVLQESFLGSTWGYYFWNGTSMATPHVAGAAALLRSVVPGADPAAIRQALIASANDLGTAGFDTSYGHGLIQIDDAINALATLDWMEPTWIGSADLSVKTYGETRLTLQWDGAVDNVSVTGYRVRVPGASGFTTTAKSATVTGLEPGTPYLFEVLARDGASNWSDPLAAVLRTSRAFIDTPGHLFYNDILWMSGEDITRGCNPPANDLFCPNNAVTRETMAAFLVRALDLTENNHSGFKDVVPGSTFANDIGRLATAGITRGCNPPANDRFCPKDPVTRETMAAFLVRALGLTANNHPGFRDVSSQSIFVNDIGRLATAGITKGCNPPANDLFCPRDGVVAWAAFPLAAVAIADNRRLLGRFLTPALAFLGPIPILAVIQVAPPPRIWLYLWPLGLGLAALGMAALVDRLPGRLRPPWLVPAAAVAIAIAMTATVLGSGEVLQSREGGTFRDGPAAAEFFDQVLQPRDRIVVYSHPRVVLEYYLERLGRDDPQVRSNIEEADRLFLVVYHPRPQDLEGVLSNIDGSDFTEPILVEQLPETNIYRMERWRP